MKKKTQTAAHVVVNEMKEEAFRQQMLRIARMYGWTLTYHTHSSIRSDPGWPDEVLYNPERNRIIFVELKTETGRIRPAQQVWIDALLAAGLEAAIWRPRDMERIVRVLGPRQESLRDGYVSPRKKPGRKPKASEESEGWEFPEKLKRESRGR